MNIDVNSPTVQARLESWRARQSISVSVGDQTMLAIISKHFQLPATKRLSSTKTLNHLLWRIPIVSTVCDIFHRIWNRSCLTVYPWVEYNGIDDDHPRNTIRHSGCCLNHAVTTKRMTNCQYLAQIQDNDQFCNVTPEFTPIRRGTAGASTVTREVNSNNAKTIQVLHYLVPAAAVKTGGMSEQ